jgi:hypothetical protein
MPTTLSVDLRQRAASAAQSLAALLKQAFADLRNETAG